MSERISSKTKRISFGKVAYQNPNRKANEVTIDIELRLDKNTDGFCYYTFSVCGDIWNARKTDILCGGQCLDTIAEYVDTPLFNEIYNLWKCYLLNDLHAGTPEQEAVVKEWFREHKLPYDYTEAVKVLKAKGLHTVSFKGHSVDKDYNYEPYTYGHGWIIEELPTDIVKRVEEIIED